MLVYPGIAHIGFQSYGSKKVAYQLDRRWLALGLCYISAHIKKEGHDVSLMDLRFLRGWRDVQSRLEESNCDVVGIYSDTANRDFAIRVGKIAKKTNKT